MPQPQGSKFGVVDESGVPSAPEPTVVRQVKVPGGQVLSVRVPEAWGAEQIRVELQRRGGIRPPDPVEETAAGMSAGQRVAKVATDTVSPDAAVEAGKRIFNNAIYEGNEIQRLFREAATGKTDSGEDVGAFMRAGKGIFGGLRWLGLPVTPFLQEAGREVSDAAALLSGSRKVGEVAGLATEVGLGFATGKAGDQLARATALAGTDPVAARTILAAQSMGPAATTSAVARAAARQKGVDPKKVEQVMAELGDRVDPALRAAIEEGRKVQTGKLPKEPGLATTIDEATVKQITDAAADVLAGNVDKSRRVFQEVAARLGTGEIEVHNILPVLKKYGLTQEEFAREYAFMVSNAGRLLRDHSVLSKKLNQVFDDPAAQQVMDSVRKANPSLFEEGLFDKFHRAYTSVENFRRSLIVTQMSTAMRNLVTGGANFSHMLLENVISDLVSGMGKLARGKPQEAVADMLTSVNALVRTGVKLNYKNRTELMRLLDDPKSMGPLYHMRLVSNVMGDVNLGTKAAYYANTLNRFQEYLIRGSAMEFKLRQLTSRHLGKDLNLLNGADIPEEIWEESLRFAMRTTFAETPRSPALRKVIKAWQEVPLLTTINPFPRFVFGNAIPFVVNHSPLGMANLLSKGNREAMMKLLAKGEKLSVTERESLSRIFSEATTGTAFLWSAWRMRQSEHAGEKWYEVKAQDGRTVDTRAFAPYSVYLGLAEAMINPDRLKPSDWGEIAVGMSRLGGTGLFFFDMIRSKTSDNSWKLMEQFAGKYLGSFAVPARQFRDLVEFDLDPAEAIMRDTKQDPLLGPFLESLPLFRQKLPAKYTPLRDGKVSLTEDLVEFDFMGRKYAMRTPMWRQLTGVSLRTKNDLEKAVDRLQIDPANIYSRTGLPEADNLIAKAQGHFMAQTAPAIMAKLKDQPDALQRAILRRLFTASKAYGRAMLKAQFPRLANEVDALRADEDLTQIMQDFGGINPYLALDEELAARGYQAPRDSRLR